jgi:hypothetical protein
MIHVEVVGSIMFVTMDGEITSHHIPDDLMPLFNGGKKPPASFDVEEHTGLTFTHGTNEILRNLSPMI